MNWLRFLAVVLTSLFTMAKLAGMIAWSWWLVMLPAIVVFGLPVMLMVLFLLLALIANACLWIRDLSKVFWSGFKDGFKETISDESSKRKY